MLRLCVSLLVAFALLSLLANQGTRRLQVTTGTVTEWQADRMISIVNEQTDPAGIQIVLRGTAYSGDPRALEPGARATVWYELVGERRPVARRVVVE